MSALLLFDIDGTLILSGGAGVRAMTRAFQAVFGVADAFADIPVAGFTDTFLLSRALERAGLSDTRSAHTLFRATYVELLREEIVKPPGGPSGVMPGIQPLLDRVSRDDGLYAGLLTGNYEPAANIKLGRFGLRDYFSWGAFGEDSPDRRELARLALARAEERGVPAGARTNVVVIGDTPHDVSCARAIGARSIAVATGSYSVEQLADTGADMVLRDLSDTAGVLRVL